MVFQFRQGLKLVTLTLSIFLIDCFKLSPVTQPFVSKLNLCNQVPSDSESGDEVFKTHEESSSGFPAHICSVHRYAHAKCAGDGLHGNEILQHMYHETTCINIASLFHAALTRALYSLFCFVAWDTNFVYLNFLPRSGIILKEIAK